MTNVPNSRLQQPGLLRFGSFEMDLESRQMRKSGALLRLGPQPFRVLALLARNAGQVISREQLQQELWGSDTFVDFEHGLNSCIRQIRAALNDEADTPLFIETIPRRGYRFIAPVEQVQPAGAMVAADVPVARRLITARVAATFALIALLAAIGFSLPRWREKPAPGASPERIRLAVLPFANLTGDATQEYLTEGITEELIAQAGQLNPERLGVIARTSAMRYRHTEKSASTVANELGVEFLLEGAVHRSNGQLRVTAKLIRAGDQTQVWAESYDRKMEGVLDVQSAIARSIAGALAIELLPTARLDSESHVNARAQEAYLKGRFFWNKRTSADLFKSIDYFEQALREDPKFASAHAGLAQAYLILGDHSFARPAEAYPKARAAAARALEIDPKLADAHAVLAKARFDYDRDWKGAEEAYRAAIALEPGNVNAHHWYAAMLMAAGRFPEARAAIERARALDPLSLIVNTNAGWIEYHADRLPESVAHFQRALELDPSFEKARLKLGFAYAAMSKPREALAEFERIRSSYGIALALAQAGETEKAKRVLQPIEAAYPSMRVRASEVALVWVALHDHARAIQWLERAVDDHHSLVNLIQVDPLFAPLRTDPRFQAVVRKAGLPLRR